MKNVENIGKKIIDISKLVDVFEAQEGEIQHIIGKTGNGKTYEGTRRALEYLKQGYVVYTTWRLILPEYYDQRKEKNIVLYKLLFNKKNFFRINLKKNWHFLDIERPDIVEYVASLTDCIVMLDEGQDIFDSRERIGKSSRKTITRTRHLRKTLIIISQRAQAVEVTARANVTYFFKCVKTWVWFWPFKPYFVIYRTEDMDQNNFPIWEDALSGWHAPVYRRGFAKQEVFDSYNSWYLRAGIPRSQEINFEAYELTPWEKIKLLFAREKQDSSGISEKELKEIEDRNRRLVKLDQKKLSTKKLQEELEPKN